MMVAVSKRTPELEQEIVERLCKGEPLAVICRDPHMPSDWTVHKWKREDPVFAEAMDHARLVGFDIIAAEALDIADDKSNDTIRTESGEQPNNEWIARSRLRVDTRLKLLAKWDPKRYGDKIQHTGADGQSPVATTLNITFKRPGQLDSPPAIEGEVIND